MEQLGQIAANAVSELSKTNELTIEQTRAFKASCAAYDAGVDRAKAAIFEMVSHMPAPGVDQDPRTAAAVYWDFLKIELSPENIVLVCRAAMRGKVNPDSDFRPIVARLISYGRANFQRNEPVQRDPRLGPPIKPKLLTGPLGVSGRDKTRFADEERPAAERARMGQRLKDLARNIRADNAEPPPQLSKEALAKVTK